MRVALAMKRLVSNKIGGAATVRGAVGENPSWVLRKRDDDDEW